MHVLPLLLAGSLMLLKVDFLSFISVLILTLYCLVFGSLEHIIIACICISVITLGV